MTTFRSITKALLFSMFLIGFGLTTSAQTPVPDIIITNNTLCDMTVGVLGNSTGTACTQEGRIEVQIGARTSTPSTSWDQIPPSTATDYATIIAVAHVFPATSGTASASNGTCTIGGGGIGTSGCPSFTITVDPTTGDVEIN